MSRNVVMLTVIEFQQLFINMSTISNCNVGEKEEDRTASSNSSNSKIIQRYYHNTKYKETTLNLVRTIK